MAILQVLHFPNIRLRVKATTVNKFDNSVRKIVADMFETMYAAPGIGLAAIQVNIPQQIIVIDVSEKQNQPLCLINPKIIAKEGKQTFEEGCLSVPDVFEEVERAEKITVEALNQKGESFTLSTDGLLAICIQHELDHLIGKLFIDYISSLKRQRIQKKLLKQKR
ncbi:MAG: peptide deformylase [Thiomargarita sp.]|nr:peptide deformylase [Thiomargarita sp.]